MGVIRNLLELLKPREPFWEDGGWLAPYRNGSWTVVGPATNRAEFQLSGLSCFQIVRQEGSGVSFIFRMRVEGEPGFLYAGGMADDGPVKGVTTFVSRTEDDDLSSGAPDYWERGGLSISEFSSLPEMVNAARAFAGFNGYVTPPMYLKGIGRRR